MKHFFKKYKLALFSGFLIGVSYIPFPPWAVLFGFTPLWFSIFTRHKNLKEVFIAAWLTQFTLTLIGFHWIAFTAHEFGKLPWVISLGALFLFAALAHLYVPLSLTLSYYFFKRFKLNPLRSFLIMALSQSLWERFWPSIFPWNLGYSLLYAHVPAYQLADLIGFEGLTTGILLLNAGVAYYWFQLSQKNSPRQKFSPLFFLIALFLILNGLGLWRVQQLTPQSEQLNISIIQANIGNHEKIVAEKGVQNFQDFILNKHITLTNEALKLYPQTQLFIWAESAIPARLDPEFQSQFIPKKLFQYAQKLDRPLITGGLSSHTPKNASRSYFYNAFYIFQNSLPLSVYRKSILLAFGEYLPFGESYPWLYKIFPFVSDFGKGGGPETLPLQIGPSTLSVGPQICYEGLFPSFSRGLSTEGAQILVNLTNDSWFTPPFSSPLQFESLQHLYMTAARSIETRRPLLRSTNTGISAGVDALGNLYKPSPTLTESIENFMIPYSLNTENTFYVKWGHWDWVFWIICFIALLLPPQNKLSTFNETLKYEK